MNITALKSSFNLLSELPEMKQHGRYWIGPCPFCGGKDRFNVTEKESGQLWVCRHCSPDGAKGKKYQDVVEYLAIKHHLDLHGSPKQRYEAMQEITRLLGGSLDSIERPAPAPKPIPQAQPAPDWQSSAYEIMNICRNTFWSDSAIHARRYMMNERLHDLGALKCWDIGYSLGFEKDGIWVPRGIVIPCFEYGDVWYFKIRLVAGDRFKCQGCGAISTQPGKCVCGHVNKYRGVKGNKSTGLFGAGTLAGSTIAFVTEGEFDAMHIWTAINRLGLNHVGVVTTGASTSYIDPVTWGKYGLLNIKKFICLYDNDEAGQKALAHMQTICARAVRASLPIGKDATEFVQKGGDLSAFIRYQINL